MIDAYPGSAVRAAEQPLLDAGAGPDLMQRAAAGLALAVAQVLRQRRGRVYGARVLVLAGPGNNGGDGLWAAAMLASRGVRTTAVATAGRLHPEGAAALRRAGGIILQLGAEPDGFPAVLAEAARADVMIDAVLGTGSRGGLRERPAALVAALHAADLAATVVACDLPSGVDADTGRTQGAVLPAGLTVTFGAAKEGLLAGPGESLAGRVLVVPIGLQDLGDPGLRRLEAADLARLFPAPGRAMHKYTRGVLGIVAGSAQYPGAAVLSSTAALETGTGMVRYLGPPAVAQLLHASAPEIICSQDSIADAHVQAWLVGPGTNDDEAQLQRARDALGSGLPVVADAGALTELPDRLGPQVILTPHAGELAAVFASRGVSVDRATIEADPLTNARRAAVLTGATVLLKGATTVVAAPTGETFSQAEGPAWLATAGSGDTLAGILGALLASLADDVERFSAAGIPARARWAAIAAMAASLHGRAGTAASGGGPLRATAVAAALPGVIGALLRTGTV